MGDMADDLERLFDWNDIEPENPKPKARDLRRIAGRLRDLKKPTEKPKL